MKNPYQIKAQEAMREAREKLRTCLSQDTSFEIVAPLESLRFLLDDGRPCCIMEIPFRGERETAECVAEAIRLVYQQVLGIRLSVSVEEGRIVVTLCEVPFIMDDNNEPHNVIVTDRRGFIQKVNCSIVDSIIGVKIRQLLRLLTH